MQDLNNVADYRPTLDELMLGQVATREKVEEEVDTRKGKVIKFGWIEGVLMRYVDLFISHINHLIYCI